MSQYRGSSGAGFPADFGSLPPVKPIYLVGGALALTGGILLYNSFFTVEPGYRAIKFSRWNGVKEGKSYGAGIHFQIPWLEYPIMYDMRARPRVLASLTGTKGNNELNRHTFFE